MSELVQRLSEGRHAVEITLRPERSIRAFRDCLDRGYVHINFPGTRGGTELGVRLDRTRTDLSQADLERETGRLTLVGDLKLDFVKVRCTADVQLPELSGSGCLEPIAE